MRRTSAILGLGWLAPAVVAGHIAHAAPAQTSTIPKLPAASPARPAPPSPAAVQLPSIDLSAVPEPCKPLAKQATAPSVSAALSARISLASCMADHAIAPLALCDCGASIGEVDAAAAPALRVLDDVIAVGDPATQVIAEHTEGELYAGFATRLLGTLPRVAPGAGESEVALRDMRKQTLEAQLGPWREAAMTSFQHVVDLAKAHPELASNPVVTTAVRDSQRRLAADVAERGPVTPDRT